MPVDGPAPRPAAQPLDPIETKDIWHPDFHPEQVEAAGVEWRQIAEAIANAGDDVNLEASHVLADGWTGETADSFDYLRRQLVTDLDNTAVYASAVASAMSAIAADMQGAQRALTAEWQTVASIFSFESPDTAGNRVFLPWNETEATAVTNSFAAAAPIWQSLDTQLVGHVTTLTNARYEFDQVADIWLSRARGSNLVFSLPPEATAPGVIDDGKRTIINTGPGDDDVQVTIDPATGEQVVTINGKEYRFPPGEELVIRGGVGNDRITVAPGAGRSMTLLGGAGNDEIHGGDNSSTILGLFGRDRLYGGSGRDRISGGDDRDYIEGGDGNDLLTGGLGDDTIYGLAGNDRIDGGEGNDYLEGATGNDIIDAGAGNDIVSGGRGNDILRAGAGNDVVYAGLGTDKVDGSRGRDRSYVQADDERTGTKDAVQVPISEQLGKHITVVGTSDFQDRVNADLDMLRASPRGQGMLASFEVEYYASLGDDTLEIHEYNNPADPDNSTADQEGDTAYINYNRHLDDLRDRGEVPPIAILYHEMAHAYDFQHDTFADGVYDGADNPGVNNLEREAVGLPLEDGRLYPDHPYDLTENALRDEMGWPRRERY